LLRNNWPHSGKCGQNHNARQQKPCPCWFPLLPLDQLLLCCQLLLLLDQCLLPSQLLTQCLDQRKALLI